ncbi:hypothetical protein NE237_028027 [Protea cynaroides]|uniref:NAC domain-containing protein n=1 Tax=Protea cynaroides TaxID=273540 RepID=A0A9Q0GPH6_9MAGN|nr:hypothetical protein NE237_028027 [Protea cynaroides]
MSSLIPSATPSVPSDLSHLPPRLPPRVPPRTPVVYEEINQTDQNMNSLAIFEVVDDDDPDSAYFNSFPVGVRFRLHDDELIVNYQQKKVMKQQLPNNRIREIELYNHDPDHLANRYSSCGEKEWYYFTQRNRRYQNGKRPNRGVGNGYWKATGGDVKIKSNGKLVGYKKTNWIMQEYRVKEAPPPASRPPDDMKLGDWVLCKIYKHKSKSTEEEVHQTENPGGGFYDEDDGGHRPFML